MLPPPQPTWADRARRLLPAAAMLAVGLAAGVAGAMAWLPPRVAAAPTIRFMITPPGNEDFLSFSLAPDGSQVAFGAEGKLWTRPLGSVEARPFADSQGAHDPFWSPDSRSVAYFKQNALWVAGIGGGESRYLCPAWNAMGGSWGVDGTILFAADFGRAIYRIPATGGERVPIRLQGEHGADLRWPSFVPGSASAFIYSSRRAPEEPRTIMAGRIDVDDADQVLLQSDANAQVTGDRLLFVRNGRLFAQPFDGRTLHLTGTPLPVAGRIGSNLYNREDYANFSATGQGVAMLAYLGTRQVDRQLMLGRLTGQEHAADRSGRVPRHRPVGGRRRPRLRAARRSGRHARRVDARPGAASEDAHHVGPRRRSGAGVVAGRALDSTSPRTAAVDPRSIAMPPTAPAATRSSWPIRPGRSRFTSRSPTC